MEDNKELKDLNKKKRFWIVLCVFLAIVFLFFLISIILIINKDRGFELNPFNKKVVETNDITATHLTGRYLDGVMVEVGEENNYPVAVMIDNLKEARPQSGLSKASVVYEAEAEGRITRYLAIYAGGKDVGEIGPIRSARSYFVDWAEEFSAAYIHCGGSPDALVKISKDNVFDFNRIPFRELVLRLERWYDVDIELKSPQLNDIVYSGVFKNEETIEEVLNVFQLTMPITYAKEDFRKISIQIKK